MGIFPDYSAFRLKKLLKHGLSDRYHNKEKTTLDLDEFDDCIDIGNPASLDTTRAVTLTA